jgi:hypothetical protein
MPHKRSSKSKKQKAEKRCKIEIGKESVELVKLNNVKPESLTQIDKNFCLKTPTNGLLIRLIIFYISYILDYLNRLLTLNCWMNWRTL